MPKCLLLQNVTENALSIERRMGDSKTQFSSQTEKLMADTKFSDYLGLNHYKKAEKIKHFIHLRLAQRPQSFIPK